MLKILLFSALTCIADVTFAQTTKQTDSCESAGRHHDKAQYKEAVLAANYCILYETDATKLAIAFQIRGQSHYELKDFTKAESDFGKLISISPTPGNYGVRATFYKDIGKYDLAHKDYDLIIKMDPTFTLSYYFKGECYVKEGKLKEASDIFNNMLIKEPKSSLATTQLGIIELQKKNYPKAKEYFDHALKNNYGRHQPFYYQGILSMYDGDYKTAADYFSTAARYNWREANIFIKRAVCYAWLSKSDSVKIDFKMAESLKHDKNELLNARMLVRKLELPQLTPETITSSNTEVVKMYTRVRQLKRENRFNEAMKLINNILRLERNNTYVYTLSGEIALQIFEIDNEDAIDEPETFNFKGNDVWNLVIEDLTTAVKLNSQNHAAYYVRGMAYAIARKKKEAINDFEKAKKLSPDNNMYTEALKQMKEK